LSNSKKNQSRLKSDDDCFSGTHVRCVLKQTKAFHNAHSVGIQKLWISTESFQIS